jgi:hypothetical protein
VRGLESLKKAFNIVSKQPFLFVWGSLLFLFMFILFIFAAIGLFLSYFLFLSVFGQEMNLESPATLGVMGITVLLLLFFTNAINAALAMTYKAGLTKRKITLTKFYSYALDRAPTVFGIMLLRDLFWLLLVGLFIGIYFQFLADYEYLDILIIIYSLFMTFILHMLFTPSFLLAGAFGTSMFGSLRLAFEFLRQKHVFFIGLYILFAFVWLFNFIPIIQIATIFFLYPLVYTAMIIMIKNTIKVNEDED